MEAVSRTEILISATSVESFEDAVRKGFARATAALRGVQEVRLKDQRMLFERGNVVGYQVNLEVVFESGPQVTSGKLGVVLDPDEYQRLFDAQEELEDLRAYDEAMVDLRTGEDVVTPWEESRQKIEQERDALRRQGEL